MSAEPIADRKERHARVWQQVGPQMGGLEYAYKWSSRQSAKLAVVALMSCRAHRGQHHFAVFAEGHGVAFSSSGRACLLAANLLPAGGE